MQTLIIWTIIFLFTALKVSQTARGKDTFIAYALIAYIFHKGEKK